MTQQLEQRVLGGKYGAIIGDSLGAMTETFSMRQIDELYDWLDDFRPLKSQPYGQDRIPGQMTDDASLLLAMAGAASGNHFTLEMALEGMRAWLSDPRYAQYSGPSTRRALALIQDGHDPLEAGKGDVATGTGASNGGAMKAAPAGWLVGARQRGSGGSQRGGTVWPDPQHQSGDSGSRRHRSRLLGIPTVALGLKSASPLARIDYSDLVERGVQLHEVEGERGSVDPIVCTIVVPEGRDRTILIEDLVVTDADFALLREGFVRSAQNTARKGPIGVYLGVLRPPSALAFAALAEAPDYAACRLEAVSWPNAQTASVIGDMDVIFVAEESFEAHRDQIMTWQDRHSFDLIVTLGERGSRALLRDGQTVIYYRAVPPVAGVVDTSGAGDCFAAAYCVQHWGGRSPDAAMRFAAALAGQHTTHAGARVWRDLVATPSSGGSTALVR